jgi:hypothetical protein
MAIASKFISHEKFTQLPNSTIKMTYGENAKISLQALGLLIDLWSYNQETWDLHKTEVYRRYGKNGRTSISNAWDELVEARFILEFKYRKGRKWDYVYIINSKPITDEEYKEAMAQAVDIYGVDSTVDFQHLKLKSSTVDFVHPTVESSQPTDNKNKLKKNQLKKNKDLKIFEEEDKLLINIYKLLSAEMKNEIQEMQNTFDFYVNDFAFVEFAKKFNQDFPDFFDDATFARVYYEMYVQGLPSITEHEAIRQMRRMKEKGLANIHDYVKYFVGGIKLNRTSESSAFNERAFEKAQEQLAQQEQQEQETDTKKPDFYNWLEERE